VPDYLLPNAFVQRNSLLAKITRECGTTISVGQSLPKLGARFCKIGGSASEIARSCLRLYEGERGRKDKDKDKSKPEEGRAKVKVKFILPEQLLRGLFQMKQFLIELEESLGVGASLAGTERSKALRKEDEVLCLVGKVEDMPSAAIAVLHQVGRLNKGEEYSLKMLVPGSQLPRVSSSKTLTAVA
jgi:hypothetical protein